MKCSRPHCAADAAPGRTRCPNHLEADRRHSAARRGRRQAAGLCLWPACDTPPAPGHLYCADHLEVMARHPSNQRPARRRRRDAATD